MGTETNTELNRISAHLDTINAIIDRQISSPQKKAEFSRMSATIAARKNNTNLSLAVLGQFSSGKSTFINALIRKSLLKVKNEATTAAATFIKKGNILSLKVVFSDNKPFEATEGNTEALHRRLANSHPNQVGNRTDLAYLIELLTTNQQIADTVIQLEIAYPEPGDFLNDITIIDTPGLFAGADHTSNHSAVTQSVIDHIADLVIVLVPAHQAMSKSLIDFLSGLKPFLLGRCIFIISSIDRVETAAERRELLAYTRNQLKHQLKIDNPTVLTCSAVAMLPEAEKIPAVRQDLSGWQSEFKQLEHTIKDNLSRNRQAIIIEKIQYLTQVLAGEIEKELALQTGKLTEEEKELRSQAVSSIQQILGGLLDDAKRKINQRITKIKGVIADDGSYIRNVKTAASNKIYNAGSGIYSSYTNIESELQQNIRSEIGTLVRNVNVEVNNLDNLCTDLSKNFEHQFKINYRALPFLQRAVQVRPITISEISLPPYNFTSFKNLVETKKEDRDTGANVGMVLGGIVGFFLGGPAGAVIGAGLGRGGGKQVAQESLDTLQPKLKSLLNEEIDTCFQVSMQVISNNVNDLSTGTVRAYEKLCSDHIDIYGKNIQQVIDQHTEKTRQVQSKIRSAASDRETLEKIITIFKH